MEYATYLKSNHWKKTRENRLLSCDHCQICGSKEKLHVHHGRYGIYGRTAEHTDREEGSVLNEERIVDLFVFCSSCHKLWHIVYGYDFPRHKILSKIRRLVKLGVVPSMAIKMSKTNAYGAILNKARSYSKKITRKSES